MEDYFFAEAKRFSARWLLLENLGYLGVHVVYRYVVCFHHPSCNSIVFGFRSRFDDALGRAADRSRSLLVQSNTVRITKEKWGEGMSMMVVLNSYSLRLDQKYTTMFLFAACPVFIRMSQFRSRYLETFKA